MKIHQAILVEVESLVADATVGKGQACATVAVFDVPCAVTVVERELGIVIPSQSHFTLPSSFTSEVGRHSPRFVPVPQKIHKTIVVEVGYDRYSIARVDSDGLGFSFFCCTKCNVLRFNRAL